jgi:hypothetical protein
MSEVKNVLDNFGRYLVKESRKNLTRKGKRDRSKLYNSLDYNVKVSPNSFEFDFLMEDYGDFVDQGVKGTKSSFKAPRSKYRLGTGTGKRGGLTNAIDDLVRRKRIQFRDKKGRFMSFKSTSFLIRRSIWQKGLETTNFYSRPFELGFNKFTEDIVEAYALELEDFLEFSIK